MCYALDLRDPRAAKVLVLRFFAGMNESEIPEVINISLATVNRESSSVRNSRTSSVERVSHSDSVCLLKPDQKSRGLGGIRPRRQS